MGPLSQRIVNASPLVQSSFIAVVGLVFVFFLSRLPDTTVEWKAVTSSLLIYGAASPLLSIFQKNWGRYILLSIGGYLLLFALLIGFANYISNEAIKELGGVKAVLAAQSIFYFILIGLTGLYRFLLAFLKKVGKEP